VRNQAFVVGVDHERRPDWVSDDVPFYLASADIISFMNFSLPKGVYLYRPPDRQILPFQGDFENETKSKVKIVTDNYLSKELFGGFFVEEGTPFSETAGFLLEGLAEEFAYVADFVIMTFEEAKIEKIIEIGNLAGLVPPYFYMFEVTNNSQRWFVQGPNATDLDYLEKFVLRIILEAEPVTILCEDIPEEPPDTLVRQLNARTIEAAVLTREVPTVLLAAAPNCRHCRAFKPLFIAAAEILPNVKFFWTHWPLNDMPKSLPSADSLPSVFIWPAGDGFMKAVEYPGGDTVEVLLKWIVENAGVEITLPEINQTELETRINQIRDVLK
jgi:hypothetical protein